MAVETALMVLYLVSLVALWQISPPQFLISMLLLLIVILLGKINARSEVSRLKEGITEKLDAITSKIDAIPKTDGIKESFNRDLLFLDSKVNELRNEYTVEMEKQYRELARKIAEVENGLGEIRRTLGAAFGTLEERLESVEHEEESTL